jgi:hypothetical protein
LLQRQRRRACRGPGVAVRGVDAGLNAEVVEDGLELVLPTSWRIAVSMSSARRAVSSIRVPVGARRCSLISPASTLGKKSRPRNG